MNEMEQKLYAAGSQDAERDHARVRQRCSDAHYEEWLQKHPQMVMGVLAKHADNGWFTAYLRGYLSRFD